MVQKYIIIVTHDYYVMSILVQQATQNLHYCTICSDAMATYALPCSSTMKSI